MNYDFGIVASAANGKVGIEDVREDKTFTPENCGMIFCPHCNGVGKFFRSNKGFEVCMVRGGSEAIRKPEPREIALKNELRMMPESKF